MKTRYVITPLVMLAVLIALSIPASAIDGRVPIDQLNKYEVILPHGDYWIDWSNAGAATTNFDVPDVNLYWVGIYNSAWMPGDTVAASWPNPASPLPYRYPHTGPYSRHTGLGTTGIWYGDESSVTTLTIPGATNSFWTNGSGHGVALPILYTDASNPNTLDSWFYQGYDDSEAYSGCDGYSHCMEYTFQNVVATHHTHWTLMVAVTCADDGNIVFNSNPVLPNGYDASTKFYHVASNDVTGMVQNGNNVVKLRTNDEYFHPYWMWLVGYTPVVNKPDLIITHGSIDAGTPRPNYPFTVTATVENIGTAAAGPFSVNLYAEGVLKGTDSVAGLAAPGNTPVSFPGVTLPEEGCYELKVVADALGQVDESSEINNESSANWQVGYVIDVRSDSDFVDLKDDPGMPSDSVTYHTGNDTYVIQDLEITNCEGDGIYIENVNSDFVIKNCTVENCGPDASGVFLKDYVTKGTIKCCTLQNNEAYGIELGEVPFGPEDPTNINITCNDISQNGVPFVKNGIDLIGADCTVKGNFIQNNAEYGIYVYGNNNKIYNNTIEDNDDYGVKLYNSSGNEIYWNDISDNNNSDKQGYDNRATNTWNTPTAVNYPFECNPMHFSKTGNYWNDHTSPDTGDDGIVDTSYTLDGGVGAMDDYPLTVSWRKCGDANRNGDANRADASLIRNHWSNPPAYPICNRWAADANCNDQINRADASFIRNHWGYGYSLNCCKDC